MVGSYCSAVNIPSHGLVLCNCIFLNIQRGKGGMVPIFFKYVEKKCFKIFKISIKTDHLVFCAMSLIHFLKFAFQNFCIKNKNIQYYPLTWEFFESLQSLHRKHLDMFTIDKLTLPSLH